MIVVTLALMSVGVVMVASTTASLGGATSPPDGRAGWPWSPAFGRQCLFAIAGLAILVPTTLVGQAVLARPAWRRRAVWFLFIATVACLIAALIPALASEHRGSQRWLHFQVGGLALGFQPSELAKPALVLLLAMIVGDQGADVRSFRGRFLPAVGAIALSVALVGKEDFGTAVLLAVVGGAILLVAGCKLRYLGCVGGLGAVGMMGLLFAAPYRIDRLTAYLDVWADPRGHGYQPIQSLTAIATGGWFGRGLGSSVQKFGYLPESHTDFIFAVICEETGIIGGVAVLGLFAAYVWLGMRTMVAAATPFERLAAFGLTAMVGLQAGMNVSVVTVSTPTTGISLPFISAGGSGLLTFCVITGVLAAIAARGVCSSAVDEDPGRAAWCAGPDYDEPLDHPGKLEKLAW